MTSSSGSATTVPFEIFDVGITSISVKNLVAKHSLVREYSFSRQSLFIEPSQGSLITNSLVQLLSDNLGTLLGFLLAVASVVVGSFLYDFLKRKRNKPRLELATKQEKNRLGFEVRSKNKTLREARVRCNHVEYEWESKEGGLTRRKDILVGDDPSVFYPFRHNGVWIDKKDLPSVLGGTPVTPAHDKRDVRGGLLVTITETTIGKEYWRRLFTLPEQATAVMLTPGNAPPAEFLISIQVIAQEIEEEGDYAVRVGLNEVWVTNLDRENPQIGYTFTMWKTRPRYGSPARDPTA